MKRYDIFCSLSFFKKDSFCIKDLWVIDLRLTKRGTLFYKNYPILST